MDGACFSSFLLVEMPALGDDDREPQGDQDVSCALDRDRADVTETPSDCGVCREHVTAAQRVSRPPVSQGHAKERLTPYPPASPNPFTLHGVQNIQESVEPGRW